MRSLAKERLVTLVVEALMPETSNHVGHLIRIARIINIAQDKETLL